MVTKAPFTFDTPDKLDVTGTSLSYEVGHNYRHSGTQKYYVVEAIIYMGELDLWGLVHRERGRPAAPPIIRSHVDYFANRVFPGKKRFTKAAPL